MNDGTKDRVSVSFPASPDFSRIGRVAVAGLALRLGVDIADVEKLRLAVDESVAALRGPGRIRLDAQWEPDQLSITVGNPDAPLGPAAQDEVTEVLSPMVDEVTVDTTGISMVLTDSTIGPSANGAGPAE
ncbi:MAG: hypothetical protein AAF962_16275 [Actinomycetota bacterium]